MKVLLKKSAKTSISVSVSETALPNSDVLSVLSECTKKEPSEPGVDDTVVRSPKRINRFSQ